MAKIKKVANGEYIGANKYTIKDAGGGKSTVDFAPDSVLTPGTEVGAELLNEMQLNALYTLDTNRVVEGQKEVYVANLEGFTDFTKPDLSFYLKINANNTNTQTYLRLDTTDYLVKCKINDLTKNSIVACRKVGNEIIVLNNYMKRQDDAIWGGLDGGGEIEDPTVVKEVGYRYYGADGKAYICLVPSNINNSTNYMPCNTVDNLDKIQNLTINKSLLTSTSTRLEAGSSPIQIGRLNEGFKYICFSAVSLTSLKPVFVNTNIMQLKLSSLRVLTHTPSLSNLHGVEVYVLNDLIYIKNLTNTEGNLIYDLKTFG